MYCKLNWILNGVSGEMLKFVKFMFVFLITYDL